MRSLIMLGEFNWPFQTHQTLFHGTVDQLEVFPKVLRRDSVLKETKDPKISKSIGTKPVMPMCLRRSLLASANISAEITKTRGFSRPEGRTGI